MFIVRETKVLNLVFPALPITISLKEVLTGVFISPSTEGSKAEFD